MRNCYCCSGDKFEDCCQPFLDGMAKPSTAEALMRSRYCAYVTLNVAYILKTTHHSKRTFHDAQAIKDWAKSSIWQKLEIISTIKGTPKDSTGTVEFKASYLDLGLQPKCHHERSNFIKVSGEWFFVDGKVADDFQPGKHEGSKLLRV